jgi:KUP system potassium uptake protein
MVTELTLDAACGKDNCHGKRLAILTIGALGVVFGDIGTSPLYALRECFAPEHGVAASPENVIGIVSLLFWTLSLIVCVKYLLIVLRADNNGEGGILALVALVGRSIPKGSIRRKGFIAILGILGASLLYSDGIITPAISVLSAVEGLKTIHPSFGTYILPLSLIILACIFPMQHRGTSKVGGLFGPVITIWFIVIAMLGISSIVQKPEILYALNPGYAILFVIHGGWRTFGVLGSIFLAMTGAEVLYADLGHFGRKPIRLSWFCLVYPALILNYLGQGAFLLRAPGELENLFYRLAPSWATLPLVVLATFATVIASQAVISGAFSLARQSVQLNYWPRVQIRHTSSENAGQVYVPFINWFLFLSTVGLVLLFRNSGNLAGAYGIAVSATMLLTTGLTIFLARKIWKVKLYVLIPLSVIFIIIDVSFFAANAIKIVSGGWIVVCMAIVLCTLMHTWITGRKPFTEKMKSFMITPENFAASIALNPPVRVHGSAVFLTGYPNGVPKSLLHNLKCNRVLHDMTIILSVQTIEIPKVDAQHRVAALDLGSGIWKVVLNYGFNETPDIPRTLASIKIPGFSPKSMDTLYYVGHETLIIKSGKSSMGIWQKRLFAFMYKNALNATDFFKIEPSKVLELGSRTEI